MATTNEYLTALYQSPLFIDDRNQKIIDMINDGELFLVDIDNNKVTIDEIFMVNECDNELIINGCFQMEEQLVSKIGAMLPIIGNVAKSLFPSPGIKDTPHVVSSVAGDYSTCNLPKEVASLALRDDDEVLEQSDLMSSTFAESMRLLSIPERAKIPTRIAVLTWNTTLVGGSLLEQYSVDPMQTYTTTGVVVDNTPLSYFGYLYNYWRGGLRFTVECMSTRFHQGQLYVAFNPNLSAMTFSQARNCTSATLDLGFNNRTSLDIPYVSSADYLDVRNHSNVIPTITQTLGIFNIFVQNALAVNGSVATNIDVNVYISALDDFEFKVPRQVPAGIQFYLNGSFQMNEEVVKTNVKETVHKLPQQGLSASNLANAAISANVVTADSQNVLTREYLISAAQSFATSASIFDSISVLALPSALFQPDVATFGLSDYHEFFRMDMKATLRINPTLFHQGALMLVWVPLELGLADTNYIGLNSLTQLPHAILNVASETSVSIDIPFSAMSRMLRTGQTNYGVLKVVVWNRLQATASASQTLNFSIWLQALNPHIAVKKKVGGLVTGAFQMEEVSDTAREVSTQQVAYKSATRPQNGYLKQEHDNVLFLLRRPNFAGATALANTTDASLFEYGVFYQVPAFMGREHMIVLASYLAANGGNRFHVSTDTGVSLNVTGFSTPDWSKELVPIPTTTGITFLHINLSTTFSGATQWSVAKEQQHVLEVPYYRRYPMVAYAFGQATSGGYKTGWPQLNIGFSIAASPNDPDGAISTYRSYLWHSVADDFMVYFPVTLGQTRIPGGLFQMRDVFGLKDIDSSFVKDLTTEGVEANPGPELSKFQMFDDERKKFAECMSGVNKLTSGVNNAIEAGVFQNLESLLTSLRNGASAIADSSFVSIFSYLEKTLRFALDCITKVYSIVNGGVGSIMAQASLLLDFTCNYGKEFMNQLNKFISSRSSFQGYDNKYTVPLLSSLCVAMFGKVCCSDIFRSFKSGVDYLMTRSFREEVTAKVASIWSGRNSFAGALCDIVMYFIEVLFEGTGFGAEYLQISKQELSCFIQEVNECQMVNAFTPQTIMNAVVRTKLEDLVVRAVRIKKFSGLNTRVQPEAIKSSDIVMKWSTMASKVEYVSRTPPVGIALVGDSKVGKSFLAGQILAGSLLCELGLASDMYEAQQQVWSKPTGPDANFYDGYRQQLIAYIDDFLKTVEAKDAEEAINMISSTSYIPNMAALEDKGTYFKSKFVAVSSNTKDFASVHGLTYPAALCTRFEDHAILVTSMCDAPVAKFCGLLHALPEPRMRADVNGAVDKVWTFQRINVNRGQVGDRVSWSTFISGIANDYKDKSLHYDGFKSVLSGVCQGNDFGQDVFFDALEPDGAWYDEVSRIVWNVHQSIINKDLDSDSCYTGLTWRESHLDDISRLDPKITKSIGFDMYNCVEWDKFTGCGPVVALQSIYASLEPTRSWAGIIKCCVGIVGVGGILTALYYGIKMFVKGLSGLMQGTQYDGSSKVRVKPRAKPSKGLLQGLDDKKNKVRRCVRVIRIWDQEREIVVGGMYCMMFEGKAALVPNHFYLSLQDKRKSGMDVIVQIEKINTRNENVGWIKVEFTDNNSAQVQTHGKIQGGDLLDLRVVYFHNANINGSPKIRQFIPTLKEFMSVINGRELPADVMDSEVVDDIPVILGGKLVDFTEDYYTNGKVVFPMLYVKSSTEERTKAGDCGRPYFVRDLRENKPLVAMHSAIIGGRQSPLGATPLVLEFIDEALQSIDCVKVRPLVENGYLQGSRILNKFFDSDIHVESEVKIKDHVVKSFTPSNTDKRKWLCHPEWVDGYMPSWKGVRPGRHALYSNAQKQAPLANKFVSLVEQRKCVKWYIAKFNQDRDVSLLSEYEVLNGTSVMQPLVLNTSCGYISKWFKDGKKEIIALKNEVREFTDVARTRIIPIYDMTFTQRYEFIEKQCELGVIEPDLLWVATLKDELRSIEKVIQGKTRVFEQPPLEFSLLVRKYFGRFLDWIKSNPGTFSCSAIGIDKEAAWKNILNQLRVKGSRGFDIDYSNYDGSVSTQAFDFFREVVDEYYKDQNVVRHALLHILQNSCVVVGDHLMFTEQGNKSGNPMTDVFNSITNVWLILVSYLNGRRTMCLPETLRDFERDVALITYGDDVICVADNVTLQYFNRCTIADVCSDLGYKVTSANKTANLVPCERIEELTFLKSMFVEKGQNIYCPMPKDVAIRELQWIDKRNMQDERIKRDLVDNSLRFMAHHGKEAVVQLQEQLKDNGVDSSFDYTDFVYDISIKQQANDTDIYNTNIVSKRKEGMDE